MASSTMSLLQLLLVVTAASALSTVPPSQYRQYGISLTVTPKTTSDGTYEVLFRSSQTSYWCYVHYYLCSRGHCGYLFHLSSAIIAKNSYGLFWCQMEVTGIIRLTKNLPFEIRYPRYLSSSSGIGYWIANARSSSAFWRAIAHLDLGTRSDTQQSNKPPIFSMLPLVRIPRNCPRWFNLTVFDPDNDHVRCRVPTSSYTFECGLCNLPYGFYLEENSCSLRYSPTGPTGYHPIELVVEDFPNEQISLYYSDGSYAIKGPFSGGRYKREITGSWTTTTTDPWTTTTTAAPTTTTTDPWTTRWGIDHWATPTTVAPTTTTTDPWTTRWGFDPWATTTAVAPTTTTARQTTTTARQTTTTVAPTTTTARPTTTTARPTTTTAHQTTTTVAPTTTTARPTTTTARQTTTTARPTTTTAPPTTTTVAPTTTTTDPWTTTTTPPTTWYFDPWTTTPHHPSIPALSKLPLQFTVLVDSYDAPSCLDGDYFPIFLAPTPKNGINHFAHVSKTLQIKVRATAQYTTVSDLIVTGPKGISKQQISTGMYSIMWTPTEKELNGHFTICFVAEAKDILHRRYQSELRCITVDVVYLGTTVTCNETTIVVEVEKSPIILRNEENLHLKDFTDSACSLDRLSNKTHLVAAMSFNTCGTMFDDDGESIIFSNEISSADPSQIITRHHEVEIAFSCAYPKRGNVTLGYTHKNPYAFVEKGFGSFTFEFEFFESQRFLERVKADTYPVEVFLKQMIFMQIEVTTSIPNTELFVESCRATPYDNPNSRVSYTIIEDGCVRDDTVQIYPSSESQFRFGMQAFEFIGVYEEVYITCSVLLCEINVPGTRCSQGCIESSSQVRKKREAVGQTSSHSISQGPLHLVKTDSEAPGLKMNLNMNIVFIVGVLLMTGVVVYLVRRPRSKYQPLPTFESD